MALLVVIGVVIALFVAMYRLGASIDETRANGDHANWRDGEHHWTDHGRSH